MNYEQEVRVLLRT